VNKSLWFRRYFDLFDFEQKNLNLNILKTKKRKLIKQVVL